MEILLSTPQILIRIAAQTVTMGAKVFDVDEVNDSLLEGGPTAPKRKEDKRRMSFLWGRPLEISEAVQKKKLWQNQCPY